jgi:acyl carrier protein
MSESAAAARPATREEFARALIEFISGPLFARHGAGPVQIDESTPLFETGIIDSLGIIDLLAFVEAAIGKPVPMMKIDMRFFGTVNRISHTFWNMERS